MEDKLYFTVYFIALVILFITFNFLERIAEDFKIQRGLKILGNLFFAVSLVVFSVLMGTKIQYVFVIIVLIILVIFLSFIKKK